MQTCVLPDVGVGPVERRPRARCRSRAARRRRTPKRRKAKRRFASDPDAVASSGPDPCAMNSRGTSKTRSYHWSDSSRSRTVIPTWCMSPNGPCCSSFQEPARTRTLSWSPWVDRARRSPSRRRRRARSAPSRPWRPGTAVAIRRMIRGQSVMFQHQLPIERQVLLRQRHRVSVAGLVCSRSARWPARVCVTQLASPA